MRRILTLTLAAIMMLSLVVVAQGETTMEYTYWDEAETQLKTVKEFEDGVLFRLIEFLVPDDSRNYISTRYNLETGKPEHKIESSFDANNAILTKAYYSYNEAGVLTSSSNSTYRVNTYGDPAWPLTYDFSTYDAAGHLVRDSATVYNDKVTLVTIRSYIYDAEDKLLFTITSNSQEDTKTKDKTTHTVVTSAAGALLTERRVTEKAMLDEEDNKTGVSRHTLVNYYDSDGKIDKIETATTEYDFKGNEQKVRTDANAQAQVTSSVKDQRWIEEEELGKLQEHSLYDPVSGQVTDQITQQTSRSMDPSSPTSEKRTLVDKDGMLLASYDLNEDEDGNLASRYAYYFEDTGKLRKTIDSTVTYDEDFNESEVIVVKNANNVMVEKADYSEKDQIWVTSRYDNITGALKSEEINTTTLEEDVNTHLTQVKNAAGQLLSSRQYTYYENEDEHSVREWLLVKYDPAKGTSTEAIHTRYTDGTDEDGFDFTLTEKLDANGKVEFAVKESRQPIFEEVAGVETWVGSLTITVERDADGALTDYASFEFRNVYDEEGKRVGFVRTYKDKGGAITRKEEETIHFDDQGVKTGESYTVLNAAGIVIEKEETKYLFSELGVHVGSQTKNYWYSEDGILSGTGTSTYDRTTDTRIWEERDAKGMLINRDTTTNRYMPFAAGGYTKESKRVEEQFSEYTGNLMTTTTVKETQANTGAYERSMAREKASGLLAATSRLAYMRVPDYGYMGYSHQYANYLYRADGSLKYTVEGRSLMDNYYLDWFSNDDEADWDSVPFTQRMETTTAASGVLTRDYHFQRVFQDGLNIGLAPVGGAMKDYHNTWVQGEYSEEIKTYDEKSGALKSVSTTNKTYDEATGKTLLHTVTVNAQGKLIGEIITSQELSLEGEHLLLDDSMVAYNDAGQTIKTYHDDGAGNQVSTSVTHSDKGVLLMSQEWVRKADGTSTGEVVLYDVNGNVVRKQVSTGGQDADGASVGSTQVYDAQGKLLETSDDKTIWDLDGNEVYYRSNTVDAKGRESFFQREGNKTTRVYYDSADNYRLRISEGNTTTEYDGMGQVVTQSVTDDAGITRVSDGAGNVVSYSTRDDNGIKQEFFADGKPMTITVKDDDGESRTTSYDHDGYINYVEIWYPDKNYSVQYDGDGRAVDVSYRDDAGRAAYYDVAENQWYSADGEVAIEVPEFAGEIDLSNIETGGAKRPEEMAKEEEKKEEEEKPQRPKGVWYYDNNAATFGIHLRDVRPDLTNKWYTVTPIDISQDGLQRFELYGGNMWILGQVNVLVEGDNVTVTYDIIKDGKGRTKVSQEYLNIFNDLGSITKEQLGGNAANDEGYQFGQPISIEKDLGGDTNVLLYVRNQVTYNTRVLGNQYLVRMWPNVPHRKQLREAMLDLMDPYEAPAAEVSN